MNKNIITFSGHGEYLDGNKVFYSKKHDANYIISDCMQYAIVNSNRDCLYNYYSGGRMRHPSKFQNIDIPEETTIFFANFAEHGTLAWYRSYWIPGFMENNGFYRDKDLIFSLSPFPEKEIIIDKCSPGEAGMPFFHSHALSHKEINSIVLEIFLSPEISMTQIEDMGFSVYKIDWIGENNHLQVYFNERSQPCKPVESFKYSMFNFLKWEINYILEDRPLKSDFAIKEFCGKIAENIKKKNKKVPFTPWLKDEELVQYF